MEIQLKSFVERNAFWGMTSLEALICVSNASAIHSGSNIDGEAAE